MSGIYSSGEGEGERRPSSQNANGGNGAMYAGDGYAQAGNGTRPASQAGAGARQSQKPNAQSIGGDWDRVESRSQPGRFYYVNKRTGQKQWERPADV